MKLMQYEELQYLLHHDYVQLLAFLQKSCGAQVQETQTKERHVCQFDEDDRVQYPLKRSQEPFEKQTL